MNFTRPAPQPTEVSHDAIPQSYVLIVTTKRCRRCSAEHSTSELYLEYELRSRSFAAASKGTQLRAVVEPQFNLPITTRRRAPTTVPFCHGCFMVSPSPVAHLPQPPRYEPPHSRILGGFRDPDRTPAAKPAKTTTTSKPKATTDDLLSGL